MSRLKRQRDEERDRYFGRMGRLLLLTVLVYAVGAVLLSVAST